MKFKDYISLFITIVMIVCFYSLSYYSGYESCNNNINNNINGFVEINGIDYSSMKLLIDIKYSNQTETINWAKDNNYSIIWTTTPEYYKYISEEEFCNKLIEDGLKLNINITNSYELINKCHKIKLYNEFLNDPKLNKYLLNKLTTLEKKI